MSYDLETAILAAREGGRAVRKEREKGITTHIKEDGTPCTNADIEAQRAIISVITERSSHMIVAEEGEGGAASSQEYGWFIDPLDNTRQLPSLEGCSVLVGLCRDGVPYIGAAYLLATDEMFFAQQGRGAYMHLSGKQPTPLSYTAPFAQEDVRILASARERDVIVWQMAREGNFESQMRTTTGTGASIIKVLRGEADAYASFLQKGPWDTCAPDIIVREAGGRITDFQGRPLRYSTGPLCEGQVVSGAGYSVLHDKILAAGKAAARNRR